MLSTTLTVSTRAAAGKDGDPPPENGGHSKSAVVHQIDFRGHGGVASIGFGHEVSRRAQTGRHPPGACRVLVSQGGSFRCGPKSVPAGIQIPLARALSGDGVGVDAVEHFAVEHGEPAGFHVECDDCPGFGVADEMGSFSRLGQRIEQVCRLHGCSAARAFAVMNRPPRCLSMTQRRSISCVALGPQFFTRNGSGFTLLSPNVSMPCGMGWNSHG